MTRSRRKIPSALVLQNRRENVNFMKSSVKSWACKVQHRQRRGRNLFECLKSLLLFFFFPFPFSVSLTRIFFNFSLSLSFPLSIWKYFIFQTQSRLTSGAASRLNLISWLFFFPSHSLCRWVMLPSLRLSRSVLVAVCPSYETKINLIPQFRLLAHARRVNATVLVEM